MNMQDWSQNVASIIDYAEHIFPDVEVVTRELSGKITKSNYKNISMFLNVFKPKDPTHCSFLIPCFSRADANFLALIEMFL